MPLVRDTYTWSLFSRGAAPALERGAALSPSRAPGLPTSRDGDFDGDWQSQHHGIPAPPTEAGMSCGPLTISSTSTGYQWGVSSDVPAPAVLRRRRQGRHRGLSAGHGLLYILSSSMNFGDLRQLPVGRQHGHPGAPRLRRRRPDGRRRVSPRDGRLGTGCFCRIPIRPPT